MALLRTGVGGLLLLSPGGLLTNSENCCCDGNDCLDNMTRADFIWWQVSCSSPWVFSFENLSVADPECEPIQEYSWKVDGEEFSTAEHPSSIEFEGDGPWTVTLTVTDDCGCQHSQSYGVIATEPSGCACTGTMGVVAWIAACEVEISGVGDGPDNCASCFQFNDIHAVPFTGASCQWRKDFSLTPGAGVCASTAGAIAVQYDGAKFNAQTVIGGTVRARYSSANIDCDDPTDFLGDITMTRTTATPNRCDWPDTITLRVPLPIDC